MTRRRAQLHSAANAAPCLLQVSSLLYMRRGRSGSMRRWQGLSMCEKAPSALADPAGRGRRLRACLRAPGCWTGAAGIALAVPARCLFPQDCSLGRNALVLGCVLSQTVPDTVWLGKVGGVVLSAFCKGHKVKRLGEGGGVTSLCLWWLRSAGHSNVACLLHCLIVQL